MTIVEKASITGDSDSNTNDERITFSTPVYKTYVPGVPGFIIHCLLHDKLSQAGVPPGGVWRVSAEVEGKG